MVSESRLIKRRRGRSAMADIRAALVDLVEQHRPVSVRQCFYLAIAAGLLDKTEQQYQAVVRLLGELRWAGTIGWGSVVDHSRSVRSRYSHDDLEDALESAARLYRRNIWTGLDVRVKMWCESESLSGPLWDVAREYDVDLYPCRGYPSLTFLHGAAGDLADDVVTHLYYVGDHDPSGVDIPRKVEEGLRAFAPDADITFTRLAVLPEQIDQYNLASRPTKKTDTRAKSFEGASVEAEAMPPHLLRSICRDAIEQHIPAGWIRQNRIVENSERELLEWRTRMLEWKPEYVDDTIGG